jgi:hypothetical protein
VRKGELPLSGVGSYGVIPKDWRWLCSSANLYFHTFKLKPEKSTPPGLGKAQEANT